MDANIIAWTVIACITVFLIGVSGMVIFVGEKNQTRSSHEYTKKGKPSANPV